MGRITLSAIIVSALRCLGQEVSDGIYGNTNPDVGSWDFLIVVNDPNIADGCKFVSWVNDSSMSISFDKAPTKSTCFNLNNVQNDIEAAKDMGIAVNATVEGQDNFGSTANYSQVLFHQGGPRDEVQKGVGYAQLEMFEDAHCENENGLRSYVWNCAYPDIACAVLPTGVRSFSIRNTTEEERKETCVRASLEKSTPFRADIGKLSVRVAWILVVAIAVVVVVV